MSDTPGGRRSEPDFTVPVPGAPAHPDVTPERQFTVPAPSEPTQVLPAQHPSQTAPRQSPSAGPWAAAPHAQVAYAAEPAERHTTPFVDAGTDALRATGHVLLGVALGWWLFLAVRLVWWVVQRGATDTMLIEVIDYVPEETAVAAIVAVVAAGILVGARLRDRRRRGTASAIVAVVVAVLTILITVWRFV